MLVVALVSAGCSKLTEPAKEEAIQGEPAGGNKGETPPATAPAAAPAPAPAPPPAPPENPNAKIEMKDSVVGKGPEAKAGDTVKVHYAGRLTNGTEFDASKKHGDKPFEFPLGAGRVIKGWDQGVAGMKVGGKRQLTIPPELGYGARGAGAAIPPNATLIFDVELVEIVKK